MIIGWVVAVDGTGGGVDTIYVTQSESVSSVCTTVGGAHLGLGKVFEVL